MASIASRIPPLSAAGMMILSRATGFATPASRRREGEAGGPVRRPSHPNP